MEVEFKILSDHLSWEDPAIEPAMEKYTSSLWPFGRRGKAQAKLKEKQEEILERHGIEEDSRLGMTLLVVNGVETEGEAKSKVNDFKEDIDNFYQEEFNLDEPIEVSIRNRTGVI